MSNIITLYKNHGGKIGFWEGWTKDQWVMTRHGSSLDAKAVTNQYEAKAKNVGRANMTTPAQQAVLEMESKARLKRDKGYVDTIEAAQAPATNTLGLGPPMLATPMDKVKPETIDWRTAYVQPKLDGHRALWKDGVLYSRQGKALDIPHIVEAIQASQLSHLHLDGELYIHEESLQNLSRLIKKQTPDSLRLEYHIYDQVADRPFLSRMSELASLWVDSATKIGLVAVTTYAVTDMAETVTHHQLNRKDGYEGTMLRFGSEGYRTGKRSRTLLKMKEFHDAEFEVVGWTPGKPYIRDGEEYPVPVWICDSGNGVTFFNVTAQGTMREKAAQFVNANDYIGKQLTVKYHYLSKDGIPQLPVALRWREDV